MILEDPSTHILVEKILPALPSLLRAPVVAVAVAAGDARTITIWWSSSTATTVRHLETDALTLDALAGKIDVRTPALAGLHRRKPAAVVRAAHRSQATCAMRCCCRIESRGNSTRHARERRPAIRVGVPGASPARPAR
jgi:hypothetical protein